MNVTENLVTHAGVRVCAVRIEVRWTLRESGKDGGLGKRELLCRNAEVCPACLFDAVGILPERYPVEVELEKFLLRVATLEGAGEEDFLNFATDAFLAREECVPGKLLCESGSSLGLEASEDVCKDGSCDSAEVNASMLEKTLIFDGKHRP